MNKTKKLAYTAMLTALAFVANLLTIPVSPGKALSFTIAICFVAGVYLGVVPALTVGFVGDLIAHLVAPQGAYNLFLAISSALFGVIAALVWKIPKINRVAKASIALAICFVVCSCGLNTFGLWLQYSVLHNPDGPVGLWNFESWTLSGASKTFWVYLVGRLPIQLLNTIVNGVVFCLLNQSKALDKAFLQNKA